MLHIHPLEFAVFFPEDGHQPCIAEGKLKKVIVKVKR
jgi:beta-galactosidase beta subunit